MTNEEATRACFELIKTLGERHARRIMAEVVAVGMDDDAMEAMVNSCVDDLRCELRAGGADEHDIDVAAQQLLVALMKEGGRLARNMIWEHGHA